jgi:ABC-2 type transport system ATP-binding protein
MHCGAVDDVGRGEEIVEVAAFHDDLAIALQEFPGTFSHKKENNNFLIKLREGFHSQDLNRFLFEKGIVAAHLLTQKKSLEKQFLEILAEADHATKQ